MDLSILPDAPGCYLFKNERDDVIYVGKAKSLKKRVRSYFHGNGHDAKTVALVSEIRGYDFIVTSTEVEALVLEHNLIKKHQPHYNVQLKDSQRYGYILVTDERYPRLVVARDKVRKGTYYGPFVNAEQRDDVLKALRTAFGIHTCRTFKKRPCLRYHIKLCSAPCASMLSHEEYLLNVEKAERFLKGRGQELVRELEEAMQAASAEQRYEKALTLRNQVSALRALESQQMVERTQAYDEDVINVTIEDGTAYVMVFHVEKGILLHKHEYVFEYQDGLFDAFIKQFYAEHPIPREIIVPFEPDDGAIIAYLTELRAGSIRFHVPQRGKKKALLDLVSKNIEAKFFTQKQMVQELGTELRLARPPRVIECFDISHTSGAYMVGSMVQFRDGSPDTGQYRRYKIRDVAGIDDYLAIKEVVTRRYERLKREGAPLPDLIVIDGGKGQLSSAYDALVRLGLRTPVISLAKREESVFVPGRNEPLPIPKKSKGMNLLIQIRDEAHRFAITYHKLLRGKGMVLDEQ